MAGFRYRLHSTEGDELGEFTTIVPNWTVGDTFTSGDGRRSRIRRMVPFEEVGEFNATWEVEPVED